MGCKIDGSFMLLSYKTAGSSGLEIIGINGSLILIQKPAIL
jgi:hypothetical protein